MAEERKSVAEMIGEFLRELALLLLVFVPLDWVFPQVANASGMS